MQTYYPISFQPSGDVQNQFLVSFSDGSVSAYTLEFNDASLCQAQISDQVLVQAPTPALAEVFRSASAEDLLSVNVWVLQEFMSYVLDFRKALIQVPFVEPELGPYQSLSRDEALASIREWSEGRVWDDTIACTEVQMSGKELEAKFPGLTEREACAGWKVLVLTTL